MAVGSTPYVIAKSSWFLNYLRLNDVLTNMDLAKEDLLFLFSNNMGEWAIVVENIVNNHKQLFVRLHAVTSILARPPVEFSPTIYTVCSKNGIIYPTKTTRCNTGTPIHRLRSLADVDTS